MITICGFPISNYYNKVRLAAAEMGIEYKDDASVFPSQDAALLARSPMGKIPFLETEHGLICESQVICEYLADRFPEKSLYPADAFARAKVRELIQVLELHLELVARRLLGAALFNGWAMGVGRALRQYVTLRNWLIGLNIYMLAVFFFTVHLYRSVHLSNWDTSYPLVIGNEAVGRRQWSGRLEWLELQGHDDSSLIIFAIYDFAGESPFEDISPLAIVPAPALVWSEGPVTPQDGEGVTVGPGEWLTTGSAFFDFSDYAREANYFYIDTRVATAARDQRGPARILSISADAEHRNLTLGQVGDDLIIRLRTPAAGENGQKPELLVPGVFADTQLRHITVNYDAPILRVTVDETEEFVISLAPGAAFFPDFTTENRYQIVMGGDPHRYDWPYVGIVVGLAVVVFGSLGLAAWWARRAARA